MTSDLAAKFSIHNDLDEMTLCIQQGLQRPRLGPRTTYEDSNTLRWSTGVGDAGKQQTDRTPQGQHQDTTQETMESSQ